jgi:prepilin signal peptidase PulO-like enzyme (type II secretory pathway)
MKAEQIFSIANLIAMLSWIILAVAPRWILTRKIILSGAIPLLLAAAYLILIVLFFGRAEGGFGSLPEVMKLFTNEWATLAGWIHYLAFDLFVGIWEVKDSRARGISHWFVIPCLVLTFLFGPIGFLLYSVLRFFSGKKGVENDEGII